MRFRVAVLALSFATILVLAAQAQSPSGAPTVPAGCQTGAAPAPEADTALYAEDWGKAGRLYREMQKQNPGSLEARAGLIRVMLGQDHVADALKDAVAIANAFPQSAVAQTILGETYVWRGELELAPAVLSRALALDPCLGQAHYVEARMQSLLGYRASAARQLAFAHALDPNNEQITVAWMWSLPPAQRFPLVKDFLEHVKYLNNNDRMDLKSDVIEAELRMNSNCTVSAPPHPVSVTLFETPLLSKQPAQPSIDAVVNSTKHRVALSTSDGGIVMPLKTAKRLGLKTLAKDVYSPLYAGGLIHYDLVSLDSVRIGDIEFKNCIASVVDEEVGSYESEVQQGINLIGSDISMGTLFLEDFLVQFDTPNKKLTLSALPPLAGPAKDATGLPMWSHAGYDTTEVNSINGGAWGQYNRVIDASMQNWTPLIRYRNNMWVPTRVGTGPNVLFLLELATPWPRISTNASSLTSKIEAVANGHPTPFHGNFMQFGGLLFPMDQWTSSRYDEFSEHLKLETSGDIGEFPLRQTSFTLDLRDNLVLFQREKTK